MSTWCGLSCGFANIHTTHAAGIESSHKSHNASDKYRTMHHFLTKMYTHVHIFATKWCIVGYGTGALWDFCNRSILFNVLTLWDMGKMIAYQKTIFSVAFCMKKSLMCLLEMHPDVFMQDISVNIGAGDGLGPVRQWAVTWTNDDQEHHGIIKQNGRHFAVDIFTMHFLEWMKKIIFWFKFHWKFFRYMQLSIIQHWFRKWLDAKQATSQYRNQWRCSLLTHVCITRPQWVKQQWVKSHFFQTLAKVINSNLSVLLESNLQKISDTNPLLLSYITVISNQH